MSIPYAKEAGAALLLIALAASHGCAYRVGGNGARLDLAQHKEAAAQQIAHAVNVARKAEQEHAADLARIADEYEQDKRDAEDKTRTVIAGLRNGSLRLQERWAGCVAKAGASAAELDAAARDREESAARIVRAAAAADAQIRGLQEVVRADRK